MYDAFIDYSRDFVRIAALAGIFLAASADAQMPGAPVLQNAWATPGIVGAVNFGGGTGRSIYAAAFGWTPGSGRFQVSGGIGVQNQTGLGSKAAYGARVAIPFSPASSTIGFAAFAGLGGGPAKSPSTVNPSNVQASPDSVPSTTQVPLGAAIGWRKAIGSNHGLSVYATPAYVLFSGGSKSGGVMRVAIGADVGITNAIGATLGVDFGGTRPKALGGPSGSQWGLGVSYALGRR
jgi:hypothetical protein